MKHGSIQERKIRRIIYASILFVVALYISQIAFLHMRFHLIDAVKETLVLEGETCDEENCQASWLIQPTHKLLLLGHIMRTHKLVDLTSGEQTYPISRVRGITADSWSGLRVYAVEPGKTYRLSAVKPKAVKMGYFIGILPRSTDHEGILSVPDISPTISSITTMAGFGVLGVLLFAAYLAPSVGETERKDREELVSISIAAIASVLVAAIVTGAIDSLLPDGEFRSRILRTCVLFSIAIIPVSNLIRNKIKSVTLRNVCSVGLISSIVNFYWDFFRAGEGWIWSCGITVFGFSLYLLRKGYRFAAACAVVALYDSVSMSGLWRMPDAPPLYFLAILPTAAMSLVAADCGAIAVLALASKAYSRFSRDIILSEILKILMRVTEPEFHDAVEPIRQTLPKIAKLTGAGRVSFLVNLPFSRPVTHIYSQAENNFKTFDDGKIPGAVAIRAFVYGDEAWFERYDEFSRRLNIPKSSGLTSAEYVCVLPVKVNSNNLGVLMLTCFDDRYIEERIKNGSIEDDREAGRILIETLSRSLSNALVGGLESKSTLSSELFSRVREAIPQSANIQEFIQLYCNSLCQTVGLRVMIHQWIDDRGVGLAQAGMTQREWSQFYNAPFNLSSNAQQAYGPTVIALKEGKSSYLKDWREIKDKLHDKSAKILEDISACTILAVPLSSGDMKFAVTLFSSVETGVKDPGVMAVVESTEAIFDAAIAVLEQKTSVLALGKLANRLIGDEDVRVKIIDAAKNEYLPTTIGTPKTSFLLLFDLINSSKLPSDTEEKAKSYGVFYDEVNKVVQRELDGKIRKTIGDAIIVTWDGSDTSLESKELVLEKLKLVVKFSDQIAIDVGCKGVRAVLHFGDYFFGLVGTSSFGQIDVIGKGIDEVCKMEKKMKSIELNGNPLKIAISAEAMGKLGIRENKIEIAQAGFVHMSEPESTIRTSDCDIGLGYARSSDQNSRNFELKYKAS